MGITIGIYFGNIILGYRLPSIAAMYPEPTLVNPDFGDLQYSARFTVSNGLLYYTDFYNLWRTDGTSSGTILVKVAGTFDSSIVSLGDVNGTLYFNTGLGVWRTDGTPGNTIQVPLNNIDPTGRNQIDFGNLAQVGKTTYFATNNFSENNGAVWKTDSLLEVATVVQNFNTNVQNLFETQDGLFFTTGSYIGSQRLLWQTDGTSQGTVNRSVTDVPLSDDRYAIVVSGPNAVGNLVNLDRTIYLTDNNPKALWRYDANLQSLRPIKLLPDSGVNLSNLVGVNNQIFFVVYTPENGSELWRSDGTTTGTALFQDIWPTPPNRLSFLGPTSSDPTELTNVNGTLFFTANDGIHGRELWKVDRASSSAVLVKDINPGADSAGTLTPLGRPAPAPRQLTNVNGVLYFIADDGIHGSELWRSDGTMEGTQMVKDIRTLPRIALDNGSSYNDFSSLIGPLTNVNGTLYFTAYDDLNQTRLWKLETPRSELLARNTDTGEVALLYLNQQNQVQQQSGLTYGASFGAQAGQPANVSVDWKIAATVDIDRNGVADLLTQSAVKDEVAIWNLGQNGQVTGIRSLVGQNGQILRTGNRDWQVIGMADIDQDKILDLVWHNPVSDEVAFWFMQSDSVTVREYEYLRDAAGNVLKTGNPKWRVEAMSDFDRDGDMDLLFRLGELNQTAIVRLNGRIVADAQYLDALPMGNLEFRQTRDQKVYWQTADNQQVVIQDLIFRSGKWESKFKSIASSGQLQGLMDLDGNSTSDLIFRNSLTNGLQFTLADARQAAKPIQQQNQTFQFGSGNWAVIQTADFGNMVAL
jgi:ELWxxDGT repeat protein